MNKFETVDEYIAAQPAEVRPLLESVRETIRLAAPDAVEKIAYQIPTYWQGENLVHFGAFKHHIGFYPGAEAGPVFGERLSSYKMAKGSIQFPIGRPIDHALITDIVHWRLEQAAGRKSAEDRAT